MESISKVGKENILRTYDLKGSNKIVKSSQVIDTYKKNTTLKDSAFKKIIKFSLWKMI